MTWNVAPTELRASLYAAVSAPRRTGRGRERRRSLTDRHDVRLALADFLDLPAEHQVEVGRPPRHGGTAIGEITSDIFA
jgi:hypothetical protein